MTVKTYWQCDRCGGRTFDYDESVELRAEHEHEHTTRRVWVFGGHKIVRQTASSKMDLCAECGRSFDEWRTPQASVETP